MLNKVVLIGRLTRDPELRYTPSGTATATFTLAVERSFSNSEGKREADFIPVVTWRRLAEIVANHVRKGNLVAVEGRIQVRNYEREGKRIYLTEVVADNVRFLDNRSKEDAEQQSHSSHNSGRINEKDSIDYTQPIELSDDDLPF
ncbi:single-stranded DNA-binding protein (plasmid) [Paenibacillus thiaminolyticus]|uniref:single-stranded DNA-binding protein n=1 Tax=Paenibacillus thiaminolyticus TaxID=49283 RepID=UPI00232FA2A3|nr:single-stranded DNA-binding protein [Paenibacillus thiaminolyticus]WCF11578.1 single-stranded DNA-binding protein [Paenibacillus thiaminolyticus]